MILKLSETLELVPLIDGPLRGDIVDQATTKFLEFERKDGKTIYYELFRNETNRRPYYKMVNVSKIKKRMAKANKVH